MKARGEKEKKGKTRGKKRKGVSEVVFDHLPFSARLPPSSVASLSAAPSLLGLALPLAGSHTGARRRHG
jgi:hypothetical protein